MLFQGKLANKMLLVFSPFGPSSLTCPGFLHPSELPSLQTNPPIHPLSPLLLSSRSPLPHLRGVEPYDPPTTVLVQRHEPQGVSTILSSTDFFQSEQNRSVILEQVDSFQLRDKYMFATTARVREPEEGQLNAMVSICLINDFILIELGWVKCLAIVLSLTSNPAIWNNYII